jgi:hypothetical protein
MDFQTLLLVATAGLVFLAGKYDSFNIKNLKGALLSMSLCSTDLLLLS